MTHPFLERRDAILLNPDLSHGAVIDRLSILIADLIHTIEYPAQVPVLFISVASVQRLFDELPYLIHQTVTPALVDDLALAVAETYLPHTLYEALDELLYDRYSNGEDPD